LIAADTSILIPFFLGEKADDINTVHLALETGMLCLPPTVVTEILSGTANAPLMAAGIQDIMILPIKDKYWFRAGVNRQLLLHKGLKAKLADTLISQSCIDHNVRLVTRDSDFRHFAKHCGLNLFGL